LHIFAESSSRKEKHGKKLPLNRTDMKPQEVILKVLDAYLIGCTNRPTEHMESPTNPLQRAKTRSKRQYMYNTIKISG
jgi:hypothetical protein